MCAAFCGDLGEAVPGRSLDTGIVRTVWMTPTKCGPAPNATAARWCCAASKTTCAASGLRWNSSTPTLGAGAANPVAHHDGCASLAFAGRCSVRGQVLNAIAGGGSFLISGSCSPALPPIVANATSALAVSPGYLGSVWGFRPELRALDPRLLRREGLVAATGGVRAAAAGYARQGVCRAGAVAAAAGHRAVCHRAICGQTQPGRPSALARWRTPGLLLVSVYGGYFNGGLGILLMALYTLTGEAHIHTANALKKLQPFCAFHPVGGGVALAGAIVWPRPC